MKMEPVKRSVLAALLLLPVLSWAQTQELKTIKLNEPDKKRGLPVMEALSLRASVREWSPKDVSLQDLSDLLWAANGINRPETKKRTAASAMNVQDVDIYVFLKDGAYLYDAAGHTLVPVVAGDYREAVVARPPGGAGGPPGAKPQAAPPTKPQGPPGAKPGTPPTPAPLLLILVSDMSRFTRGAPEMKKEFADIDTGIVAQNIMIFCAGTGLVTRPRASMDRAKIKTLLKLTDTQLPLLNLPVGYPK